MVNFRGISAAECPEPSHLTQFRRTGPLEGAGAINVNKKWNGPTATHAHHIPINVVQPPFPVIRKPVDSANKQRSSVTAELMNGPEVKETRLDASSKKTGIGRKRKQDESCSNCARMDREMWFLRGQIRKARFERNDGSNQRSLTINLQLLDQPVRQGASLGTRF